MEVMGGVLAVYPLLSAHPLGIAPSSSILLESKLGYTHRQAAEIYCKSKIVYVERLWAYFSSSARHEDVRHLLYGSLASIRSTIYFLHTHGYADPNNWSDPMSTGRLIRETAPHRTFHPVALTFHPSTLMPSPRSSYLAALVNASML